MHGDSFLSTLLSSVHGIYMKIFKGSTSFEVLFTGYCLEYKLRGNS